MSIKQISSHGFRNIRNETVQLQPGLNWIYGPNGSGKTSFLEALYFLTTGRSFRTRHLKYIFAENSEREDFILHGLVQCNNGSDVEIGIRKSKQQSGLIKVGGQAISAASELVVLNPISIVQPHSFDLLYGSPKVRRRFFDWGVFHVEHQFRDAWRQYNNCLKQRNSLLRTGRIDKLEIRYWNQQLANFGEQVWHSRQSYLEDFKIVLATYTRRLLSNYLDTDKINFTLKKGWDKNKTLAEMLDDQFEKDLEKRFTQYGPHRADFIITIDRKAADQWLSRGQQKLLIMALYLAQIELVQQRNKNMVATVLLDDISAELDARSVETLIKSLLDCGSQVIATTLQDPRNYAWERVRAEMFHVEHGQLSKQSW